MCELTTMLMIGSTVMGGVGAIQQGNAQAASAKYNAQVADMNSKLAQKSARDAVARGQIEEQQQRAKTSALIGQKRVAMAANGVDMKFGSPLDDLIDTATMGELDALTIRSNTYREERDIRQQGLNSSAQAGLYRAEAKSAKTGGFLNAFGTVLGGAADAYGNYRKTNVGAYA